MAGQKIKDYIRGDTRAINLEVVESDGVTPFNLANCEIFFTLNASNDPLDDSAALIELSTVATPSQITIYDVTTGIAQIKLLNTNTQNIDAGTYYYDVQIIDYFGNITSLPQGQFVIVADISRRIV